MLVVGEKSAFNGASMDGWTSAAEDKFRRESILMRAVGGGVDKSSRDRGFGKSGRGSFAKSVARYSLPLNGSNSFARFSTGVRGYMSYGANLGDWVSPTRRWLMGEKELAVDNVG